jgi:hypothetical protein
MRATELAERIAGAVQFGEKWKACCPAHDDRRPSLTFKDGDKGVLLKCFAGCELDAICQTLGIRETDLFYDAPAPRGTRPIPKPIPRDPRDTAFRFELAAFDLRARSEKIVDAAKQIDVSILHEDELDRALSHVAQGYRDLDRANLFEDVADDLRDRFGKERP